MIDFRTIQQMLDDTPCVASSQNPEEWEANKRGIFLAGSLH